MLPRTVFQDQLVNANQAEGLPNIIHFSDLNFESPWLGWDMISTFYMRKAGRLQLKGVLSTFTKNNKAMAKQASTQAKSTSFMKENLNVTRDLSRALPLFFLSLTMMPNTSNLPLLFVSLQQARKKKSNLFPLFEPFETEMKLGKY